MRGRTLGVLLVASVLAGVVLAASPALARTIETYDAAAPLPPRTPSGPPLIANAAASGSASGLTSALAEDASASAPADDGDPLAKNGLVSPLCRGGAPGLSSESRRNCQTSRFEAAAAPTANYALDVHIDGGLLGVNSATLMQDYLIAPVWMGLVWILHALVVAFEWCFTLDLPDEAILSGLAGGLRATEATFTQPWLGVVLAVASLLALYHGIVRRRVADSIGGVTAMLAMMALGLWWILDPTGTIGVLGRWSDEISLATLASIVDGTPDHAPRTLADSMGGVFVGAVGEPWCFLEFGDVGWCADPARLDSRLYSAGLRLVRTGQSARLLREANTNGQLFLALPANQTARNSINSSGSLLRVLCSSSDATACHGPTAEMAEFRTQAGTYARLEGLILIGVGALGLIMLLGFLALQLLGSGVVSLFYLLLAPVAVLAPAFGDHGRAIFRNWATRLLGSVTSKVLYAFMLGVVLRLSRMLMGLPALGFWTRWMLLSALWWGGFHHRHQALGLWGERRVASPHARRLVGRGLRRALPRPGLLITAAGRAVDRSERWVTPRERAQITAANPRHSNPRHMKPWHARPQHKLRHGNHASDADEQVLRVAQQERRSAEALVATGPDTQVRLDAERKRLARIRAEQARASMGADSRRATLLGLRAERLEAGVIAQEQAFDRARSLTAAGGRGDAATQNSWGGDAIQGIGGGDPIQQRADPSQQGARFLDDQAILPAAGLPAAATHGGERRDYPALAGLVGFGAVEYEQLDASRRRRARAEVDRELGARRRLRGLTAEAELAGHRAPKQAVESVKYPPFVRDSEQGSPLMRDVFEFIDGRKGEMGWSTDPLPLG